VIDESADQDMGSQPRCRQPLIDQLRLDRILHEQLAALADPLAQSRAQFRPRTTEPTTRSSQTPPDRDVSGRQLAGAPRYTFNIGADYRIPVFDAKEFHTSANVAFNSKFNSDNSLSEYGWIPKSFPVDWTIGIGNLNKSFDVSFVAKNVLPRAPAPGTATHPLTRARWASC